MTWTMMYLNRSVATLIATLQLLDIYRFDTFLKLNDVVTKWQRLQFAQEFTSSRHFQHSRLIDVGGAIAQSSPWIGFVARLSRTHRFYSFNPFFFPFHWIIIITRLLLYSLYTLSRGLKTRFHRFTGTYVNLDHLIGGTFQDVQSWIITKALIRIHYSFYQSHS